MANTSLTSPAAKATIAVPQPRSYQEMLNYLLPTKIVGGQTFVPRITTNNPLDINQLNDFDHWHNASTNPHTHIGDDIAYSRLNSATGKVEYLSTKDQVNQSVSVGAPVGGVFRVVANSTTNEVQIVTAAGVVFSVMHMSAVDTNLNGMFVAPGTHIGTMDGVGAGGVKHVHLDVFQTEIVKGAKGEEVQAKVFYDPQEVMALGTTGRYVIWDNSKLTPSLAVVNTQASDEFWRTNSNIFGEGQREATITRSLNIAADARTVTAIYDGRTATTTYDAAGRSSGGQQLTNQPYFSQTSGNTSWLVESQIRQNKIIDAALTVVLPAEDYRANIYNDGFGIPTVGYGYALINKNGSGYVPKSVIEIRSSLAMAGVNEETISKINFRTLSAIAEKLSMGDRFEADALTTTLFETVVFSSAAQARVQVANRLAVELVDVVRVLGGIEVARDLNVNQMGAILSLYDNSPKLIGKNFVTAIQGDDFESAAQEIALNSNRGEVAGLKIRRAAESALFMTPMLNSVGPTSQIDLNDGSNGYWENRTAYDPMTGLAVGPENRVWVDGSVTPRVQPVNNGNDAQAAGSLTAVAQPKPVDAGNQYTRGAIYLSRDGSSATLQDGQVVNAGPGGSLSFDSSERLVLRQPLSGYEPDDNVYVESIYNSKGLVSSGKQYQILPDPVFPSDLGKATLMQQGQTGEIIQIIDGERITTPVIYWVGLGWMDAAAAAAGGIEFVLSIADWQRARQLSSDIHGEAHETFRQYEIAQQNLELPDEKLAFREVDLRSIQDIWTRGQQQLADARQSWSITLTDSGQVVQTDGGAINGYGPGNTAFGQLPTMSPYSEGGAGAIGANSYNHFLNTFGRDFTGNQQDALAAALDSLQIGGDNNLSFIRLNETATLIQNADGDVVGEIDINSRGWINLKAQGITGSGGSMVVDFHIDGQGKSYSAEQYSDLQMRQAASALGLVNTLMGLQNWDAQSDLSHAGTLVAIYNQMNALSDGALGGSSGLGSLGKLGAGLGLLAALESGNLGGTIVNGIAFADAVGLEASKAIADALGLAEGAADGVVPGLGFVLALESGDPVSITSSGLSLMSSLGVIGPWGAVAGAVLSVLGGMLGGEDIPMREGQAQANWDASGNLYVSTTQDIEGGGVSATSWMDGLVKGLQQQLTSLVDENGEPLYGLVAPRLPGIGYQYDPDGLNYAGSQGHLYLKWVDGQGQEQTRYYNGAGERNDGTGDTLAGDFMKHAVSAIMPAWEAQTVLAHWQATLQSGGVEAANAEAQQAINHGLPQETADRLTQTLQVLTFEVAAALPAGTAQQLVDTDGDGYLEMTQWVNANQAMLGIDLNSDGAISSGELVNLSAGNNARNSLRWLDANGDGLLDASDPAFFALRVWLDSNQDGASDNTELQSFTAAAISAIDFRQSPPQVVRFDGSVSGLTLQQLQGNVLGVAFAVVEGGVLESHEAGETVLHAINTRAFDGMSDHIHGGDVDLGRDGVSAPVLIDIQDARLLTTTANTLANRQPNPLVFVPLAASSLSQAQIASTQAIVASAGSGLFGAGQLAAPLMALAAGAAAVQWPSVASAATGESSNAWAGVVSPAAVDMPPVVGLSIPAIGAVATDASGANEMSPAIGHAKLANLQYGRLADLVPDVITPADLLASEVDALEKAFLEQELKNLTPVPTTDTTAHAAYGDAYQEDTTHPAALTMSSDLRLVYPSVVGERLIGTEDTGMRFRAADLLGNDATDNTGGDPTRPMLSISAVGNPIHGQVALWVNAAGGTEVVFIPEANYHGMASFSYTVTDQFGLSSVAQSTIEVEGVNDAPTTQDESASGSEDNVLLFNAADLLSNDRDVDSAQDGDVLHVTRVGLAQHGTAFLDANGQVRFVPEANYNGPAQFSYWVGDRTDELIATGQGLESPAVMRLNIVAVNDLPVVLGESIASNEDVVLNITQSLLLANDTDVDVATDGQVLTISAVSSAQHGSVALLADGSIQFTPEQDYFGTASFIYTVDDGNGGLVQGMAIVNLASVNDVPVVNNELLMGKRDATYTFTQAALLANDTDLETPAGLSITAVHNAQHGSVVMNANDTITFAAEAGYAGRASFDYVVQDTDGGTTVGTTEVDVSRINLNPVAVDDSFTGFEDTGFIIQPAQLLVNDSDTDASGLSQLTVDAVGNASHGTVTLQADGSVRFQPDADYFGAASFDYRSNDGEGGQTWATAHLTVQSVNDAPVIEAIWYGWPVYGYQLTFHPGGGDGDPGYTEATQIQNEAQARALLADGNLYSQTLVQTNGDSEGYVDYVYSYAHVAPTYYRNGMLQPVGFESKDSDFYSLNNPFKLQNPGDQTIWPIDGPQRMNGGIVAYDPDGDSSAITFSLASTPQHGHAFINEYTTRGNYTHQDAASYMVQQAGAWQYFSHAGDTYSGADPFAIRVTDGAGATIDVPLAMQHVGSSAGGGGSCPIVIDLDGDGIELVRPEDSNVFVDINADGWRDRIGWAAKDDGVLTIDLNRDGKVDLDREISFVGYKPGAQTDLDGLAAFDTDGDGKLTSLDAQWAQFGVFRDANGNGRQDANELLTLDQMGISAINLQRHGMPELNNGNVVFGMTEVSYADGHTRQAGDVMFAGQGIALPTAAQAALPAVSPPADVADTPGALLPAAVVPEMSDSPIAGTPDQDARLMQMALLFNQYCSAGSSQAEPLGVFDLASANAASMADNLVMAQIESTAPEHMAA